MCMFRICCGSTFTLSIPLWCLFFFPQKTCISWLEFLLFTNIVQGTEWLATRFPTETHCHIYIVSQELWENAKIYSFWVLILFVWTCLGLLTWVTTYWPGLDNPQLHEYLRLFCQDRPTKREAVAWALSGQRIVVRFLQAMVHMEPLFMEAIVLTVTDTAVWVITAFVQMIFLPAGLFSRLKRAAEEHFSPLRVSCTRLPRSAWWWMPPFQRCTTVSELCWM